MAELTEEELAEALLQDAAQGQGFRTEYDQAMREARERAGSVPLQQLDRLAELTIMNARVLSILALRAATRALADCDAMLKDREPEEAEDCAIAVGQLIDIAEKADRLADKILTASGR